VGENERKSLSLGSRAGTGGASSPNTYARLFNEQFAAYHGARFGVGAANGTVTLEIALKAGGFVPATK